MKKSMRFAALAGMSRTPIASEKLMKGPLVMIPMSRCRRSGGTEGPRDGE